MIFLVSVRQDEKIVVCDIHESTKKALNQFTLTKNSDGKYECGCGVYRLRAKGLGCNHMKVLNGSNIFEWDGIITSGTSTEEADIPIDAEIDDCGIYIHEEGSLGAIPLAKRYIFHPVREDVHLHQIMDLLRNEDVTSLTQLNAPKEKVKGEKFTLSRLAQQAIYAGSADFNFDHNKITELELDEIRHRHLETSTDMEAPAIKSAKFDKPTEFAVEDDVWDCLTYCAHTGENALLLGPSGTGKTELSAHVSNKVDVEFTSVDFGAMSEPRIALIGATHYKKERGTYFKPSRLVMALGKSKGLILFDELSRSPAAGFNIVLPLLDRQGYLSIDELDEDEKVKVFNDKGEEIDLKRIIEKGEKIGFFATANLGAEYTGTMAIDRALLDRFAVKVELDYPKAGEEARILKYRHPKVNKNFITKIVDIAHNQRGIARGGNQQSTTEISTRMLFDCVKMVENSLDPKVAVKFAILGCFPSDGGEHGDRMKVAQLFQAKGLFK